MNRRSIYYFLSTLLASFTLHACQPRLYPTASTHEMYRIDSLTAMDSSIVQIYAPYKKTLEKEMNRVIGSSKKSLTRPRDPETLAGNFFADALLALGKEMNKEVEIAVATKDGMRTEIRRGPITVGSIFEFMPFENNLTLLQISGKDLKRLVDFIIETKGQPIAGLKIEVKSPTSFEATVNGHAIKDDKLYHVVTYDYLANGGDNIYGFENPTQRTDCTMRMREGLIQYIENLTQQGKQVDANLEGRMVLYE